jgi:hypothetical protein
MTAALIILQNAWLKPSSLAYCRRMEPTKPGYTRQLWEYALWQSRTGKRLEVMLDRDDSWAEPYYYIDESTPVIATDPKTRPPADPSHVRRLLDEQRPQVVVACGVQALDVTRPLWAGHLIATPHPTYRPVTDDLFRHAGRLLRALAQVPAAADTDPEASRVLTGARVINARRPGAGADAPVRLLFVQERGRTVVQPLD